MISTLKHFCRVECLYAMMIATVQTCTDSEERHGRRLLVLLPSHIYVSRALEYHLKRLCCKKWRQHGRQDSLSLPIQGYLARQACGVPSTRRRPPHN